MRKDDIVSDIMNKRQAKSITNKVVLKLREARGEISQYKLAKGTGMSESSISKIECLKQNPSFMTLAIIAEYLGTVGNGDSSICGGEDRRTLGTGNVGAGVGADFAGDGVHAMSEL